MSTPEISIEDQAEAFKAWKVGIQVQIWHNIPGEWRDTTPEELRQAYLAHEVEMERRRKYGC